MLPLAPKTDACSDALFFLVSIVQERKAEWAEEEERRRAALPDPNCPPGMRMLTEEERYVAGREW
jgi:hypothetical protein